MKIEFSRQIFEKSGISIMKFRPVGGHLFHTDGWTDGQTDRGAGRRTDTMKLIAAFRNFVNAHKKDTRASVLSNNTP
jgi:hypothetical protein